MKQDHEKQLCILGRSIQNLFRLIFTCLSLFLLDAFIVFRGITKQCEKHFKSSPLEVIFTKVFLKILQCFLEENCTGVSF